MKGLSIHYLNFQRNKIITSPKYTLSMSLLRAFIPLVLQAVAAAPILLESRMLEAEEIDEF